MSLLDRVKFIMKITDDSRDAEIQYYLDEVTTSVLAYCNKDILEKEMESLVVNKVATMIGGNFSFSQGSTESNRKIASISRGGMSITYADSTTEGGNSGYSNSLMLSEEEKKILKKYRRIRR